MNDLPYIQNSAKLYSGETVACMTRCALDVKKSVESLSLRKPLIWGVNLLASRNDEALAVALAAGQLSM